MLVDDMYQEYIVDQANHPQHFGSLGNYTHAHSEVNPSCGDTVHIELRVEGDSIADVAWQGQGCVMSQAAASVLSDWLIGKQVAEVADLTLDDILQKLGLETISPGRVKCVLLLSETAKRALGLKGEL